MERTIDWIGRTNRVREWIDGIEETEGTDQGIVNCITNFVSIDNMYNIIIKY